MKLTARHSRRASAFPFAGSSRRRAATASAAGRGRGSLLPAKTILVPVDFSSPARGALRYAAMFARRRGAKLVVLSVIEPVVYPDFAYFPLSVENDEVVKALQRRLKMLCVRERLGPDLVETTAVRMGNPFQEICAAASALRAGLIIMATHGYTGFRRVWLGSTAERVLRHASCPVLVVPARSGLQRA